MPISHGVSESGPPEWDLGPLDATQRAQVDAERNYLRRIASQEWPVTHKSSAEARSLVRCLALAASVVTTNETVLKQLHDNNVGGRYNTLIGVIDQSTRKWLTRMGAAIEIGRQAPEELAGRERHRRQMALQQMLFVDLCCDEIVACNDSKGPYCVSGRARDKIRLSRVYCEAQINEPTPSDQSLLDSLRGNTLQFVHDYDPSVSSDRMRHVNLYLARGMLECATHVLGNDVLGILEPSEPKPLELDLGPLNAEQREQVDIDRDDLRSITSSTSPKWTMTRESSAEARSLVRCLLLAVNVVTRSEMAYKRLHNNNVDGKYNALMDVIDQSTRKWLTRINAATEIATQVPEGLEGGERHRQQMALQKTYFTKLCREELDMHSQEPYIDVLSKEAYDDIRLSRLSCEALLGAPEQSDQSLLDSLRTRISSRVNDNEPSTSSDRTRRVNSHLARNMLKCATHVLGGNLTGEEFSYDSGISMSYDIEYADKYTDKYTDDLSLWANYNDDQETWLDDDDNGPFTTKSAPKSRYTWPDDDDPLPRTNDGPFTTKSAPKSFNLPLTTQFASTSVDNDNTPTWGIEPSWNVPDATSDEGELGKSDTVGSARPEQIIESNTPEPPLTLALTPTRQKGFTRDATARERTTSQRR